MGRTPAGNLTRGEDTVQSDFSYAVRQGQVRGVRRLGDEAEGHADIGRQKLCSRLGWGDAQPPGFGRNSEKVSQPGGGWRRDRARPAALDVAVQQRVEARVLQPETHMAIPAVTDRVDRVERTVLSGFWLDVLVEAVLDDGVNQGLLAAEVVVQSRGFDTGTFTHGARRRRWLSRLVHELGCRQ